VAALAAQGYATFNDIINLEVEELAAIPGIDEPTATLLMEIIDELTVEIDEEWDEEAGGYVESGAQVVEGTAEGTTEGAVAEDGGAEEREPAEG
jgi:hypothetical protein